MVSAFGRVVPGVSTSRRLSRGVSIMRALVLLLVVPATLTLSRALPRPLPSTVEPLLDDMAPSSGNSFYRLHHEHADASMPVPTPSASAPQTSQTLSKIKEKRYFLRWGMSQNSRNILQK